MSKYEIQLTAEAKHALKFSGPSNNRLKQILLSNEERHMPTSEEARWMAGAILFKQGFDFVPTVALKQKTAKAKVSK